MSDYTEQVCEHNEDHLLSKANVTGVAGGKDKVIVFVTQKKPLNELNSLDVVDEQLDGVETDVIEVGDIRPMINPGASIGLANAGTGTFGGPVVDENGIRYMLTNNHVAAASNQAGMLADILYPGPADGNGIRIGRLARYEPIYFDKPNYIDAALVRADDSTQLGSLPKPSTTTGRVGWFVQKAGRTTGLTTGEIIGRNATFNINYGEQGTAQFKHQIVTDGMLEPGDSGSVLLSRSGYPVGLCFAGSDKVGLHNPINLVLRTLAVSFT